MKDEKGSMKDVTADCRLPTADFPQPDLRRAEDLLMALLALPGGSCHETEVLAFIRAKLLEAGAPEASLSLDQAHRRSPAGGEIGNLICKLPGTAGAARRLLMAHADTVPICAGARPVRRGDFIVPADKHTGLGGDDRAGTAVVLATALQILREQRPHPPLTFFWTVQEELGLHGAQYAGLGALGKPRLAFNFDGGATEKVTIGATGGYRMAIRIDGIASHAGAAPEKGVSAIVIAALAIAELQNGGWHGRIEKDGHCGTSNVGVFHGGDATNVVTPRVEIRAEARSHEPAFRRKIVKAIERAFHDAARRLRNEGGSCGKVRIEGRLDYEAFVLPGDNPSVLAACRFNQPRRSIGGFAVVCSLFIVVGRDGDKWLVEALERSSDGLLGETGLGSATGDALLSHAGSIHQRWSSRAASGRDPSRPGLVGLGRRVRRPPWTAAHPALGDGRSHPLRTDATHSLQQAVGVCLRAQPRLHVAGRGSHDRPRYSLQIPHQVPGAVEAVVQADRPVGDEDGVHSPVGSGL
jgi:tripeptide aminopeptidase